MKYIKGYNGLRGLSIILVLITHLGFLLYLPDTSFYRDRVAPIFSGRTGVNIFFVLSGFLITRILIKEKQALNTIDFKVFFIKRFLRLLPPLIIFFVIYVSLLSFGILQGGLLSLFFSVFYIYNFVPNSIYSVELGHTWSLALEEQFYLIWPFIINLLHFKRIILLAILIILLCIPGIYILKDFSFERNNTIYYLNVLFDVDRWFIPAIAPIMTGSIFSILCNNYNDLFGKRFFILKLNLFFSIILFICPLYMPSMLMNINYIFQSVGIALFLCWIYYNQTSRICNALEFYPLSYVGKIYYGIYVYQGLFLRTGPGGDVWFQKFPVNIILTFLVAIISFEIVEKRVLTLKKRYVAGPVPV